MRFTLTTAVLALASSVFAQTTGFDVISKPTDGEVIPAGSTYLIKWEPSTNATWTGPVTIDLVGGKDQKNQDALGVLAKGVASSTGEYSWAVDKSLGAAAVYGLRITLESDPTIFQWSFPFKIAAASGSSSSTTATSTSSSSSSIADSSTTTSVPSSTGDSTTITTPTITSAPTGGSGNLSTTGSPSKTLTTKTSTGTSQQSPTGSTVNTNPGAIVRASSIALFGGFALALFAL